MVVLSYFMTGSDSEAVQMIFCVDSDTGKYWTMFILSVSFSASPLVSYTATQQMIDQMLY